MRPYILAAALGAGLAVPSAMAADLGGNCCADLEERVAELEATAARKGNRKVSLTVYGQVNAGVLWVDPDKDIQDDDVQDATITQSGVDPSYIGFRGDAKIREGYAGGFVIEIDLRQLDVLNSGLFGEPTTRVRQSALYLSTPVGKLTVGKTGQATQGFDEIDLSQTGVVARTLSLQPLADTYLTGIDLPWWDGDYQNVVRYDSPSIGGFVASASWGSAAGGGDNWDVAIRYAGEFGDMRIAGGVGYRHDEDITVDILDITTIKIPLALLDTSRNVFLATGSVQHVPSGLFLTGEYGDQDWSNIDLGVKGWHVKGGIEPKLVDVGRTSFYGEYADQKFDLGPDSASVTMWGVGVVQAIDPAAMHLYAAYRVYDIEGTNISHVMAGARIKF